MMGVDEDEGKVEGRVDCAADWKPLEYWSMFARLELGPGDR